MASSFSASSFLLLSSSLDKSTSYILLNLFLGFTAKHGNLMLVHERTETTACRRAKAVGY
ncbi:uncharacterized protein BT62DRAFT_182211 [Guyanagaster necrorhizus]|uniref:Uncharacterized protein n=1 Tax=Guyanagaster necrorhizus TaxID=856835 RepID=A0A9P7VQT0_9AGAR|nr:uncharacterized protein BT62DRAFT_182211 [Guyanagaster necrorhizus MCA 3950]KAG7445194.1 hypothetical protein BT62DRAFT_182211 [Guyanagaster necrorhizus MCA 3950]